MNAIELQHVSKKYDNFTLEDISFTLPQGCIMGLIGENGAGKSTIINCILNIVEKDHGDIELLGQQLNDTTIAIREDIGVVFDVSDFYDNFTLQQTQHILKDIYKKWNHSVFETYTTKFSLPQHKLVKDFSRGMKMKLSIAIALSYEPKVLILDEATSGLDPIMRDEILDVFLDFVQDEQHSILLSSHISSDLEKVADYITFIHEGKLLLSSSKDELIYEYGIMKCRSEDFEQIDQEDIVRYRKLPYEIEVLVRYRDEMKRKYPMCIIDPAHLDDIMMLYVKGETK